MGSLWAVQMTESHVVDNIDENKRILSEHPDYPGAIAGGRLKGKLKVTRAFGAGHLKQAKLTNALMGILRVRNLSSPPYLGVVPCVSAHSVSEEDSFVVLGSDGLFDFFTNDEVVSLVHNCVLKNQSGDPAKYMLEQLLLALLRMQVQDARPFETLVFLPGIMDNRVTYQFVKAH